MNEREVNRREKEELLRRMNEFELIIGLKDNDIRVKDTELRENDLEIQNKNDELAKKDKLIEYQLGVVDRLIKEIEERESEQQCQQAYDMENPEERKALHNFGQ